MHENWTRTTIDATRKDAVGADQEEEGRFLSLFIVFSVYEAWHESEDDDTLESGALALGKRDGVDCVLHFWTLKFNESLIEAPMLFPALSTVQVA
ncbi:hypothetical protein Ae201684P_010915 [Aphanomyces euteiches]|uniref:Uncharacterized protein n=1 Tax=Aphanomyces euteiches TaxID=100861 RepID=A0A6G0XWT5_9STRA|nr:hypothetical protein Ae201684_000578 [Aphanomyces euteiches]KAH9091366.1 hypothetical protein Ae201684P_010915 [Aphanomyces euteiches]